MKYIDADSLRAELEKRLKNVRDYMNGAGMKYKGPKYFKAQGKESAYDALLNIIDSLQPEQPKADLEKEARHVYESWMGGTMDDVRRDMVELGKVLDARKEESVL